MTALFLLAVPLTAGQSSFDATFDTSGGNEWWVEVFVDGNEPVVGVDARANEGPWHALEKKDWGAWAKSFHVPEGSVVQFRAHSSTGETDHSGCYRWTSGETVSCDYTFDAWFDTSGGNEWWVEASVRGNRPIVDVEARDDGGPWVELEKRWWGDWAESFHVEDGSLVQFRATANTGETDVSGEFRWPGGEQVTPEPDADVAFAPKAGNEWWIETYAPANTTVASLDARVAGGTWHELTLRDWGAWAASFQVPDGSVVQFRTVDADGEHGMSTDFIWPHAVPVDEADEPWPQEGSYARYEVEYRDPVPTHREADVTFVYHNDGWRVFCRGFEEQDGEREPYFEYADNDPPTARTDGVSEGDRVDVEEGGCRDTDYEVTVMRQETQETHHNGDRVTVNTWYGEANPGAPSLTVSSEWEMQVGLVVEWERARHEVDQGSLKDTDAPIV